MPYSFNEGRPASKCDPITPSDSTDLPYEAHYLYIGVSGHVTFIPAGMTTSRTWQNFPIGILPMRVRRVLATGTTAASIQGCYD
jgi:hypothetical protein